MFAHMPSLSLGSRAAHGVPQTDLMPGANVKVLAIVTQPDGSKRVQTAVGWMTYISKEGKVNLQRV